MTTPRGRLTDSQSRLAGDHYPLAVALARERSARCPWLFDLYLDSATDGLLDAARHRDTGHPTCFAPAPGTASATDSSTGGDT